MRPTFDVHALAAFFTPAALAQPKVLVTFTGAAKVQNNCIYILPSMPSYGIAQGSIFDLFGTSLALLVDAINLSARTVVQWETCPSASLSPLILARGKRSH
jgi:hypothetical protein